MADIVKLGLIQMSCVENRETNLEKAVRMIREAADQGAQVICLQELFSSLYFCQTEDVRVFDLAEPIPGPTTDRLRELSRELNAVIVASLFEKRAPGLYHNTSVVLDPVAGHAGTYRKMHIPDDPLYYEKFYFTPGDLGFSGHQTRYGNVGVLVCWDQWFPEAARLTALAGAQVIFYPTAIGWLDGEQDEVNKGQHEAWETVQRGHAVANGVFVAAINRVGREGSLRFWGQSFVCDPFGRILARASATEEETLVVPCDLGLIEQTRRSWPFLRDRRVESYSGIGLRFLDKTGQ